MKDSWGPLKALAVASVVNAIGDIVLCSFLGYGIAGAAWATMVSQVRTKNFNIDFFQAEYNLLYALIDAFSIKPSKYTLISFSIATHQHFF